MNDRYAHLVVSEAEATPTRTSVEREGVLLDEVDCLCPLSVFNASTFVKQDEDVNRARALRRV